MYQLCDHLIHHNLELAYHPYQYYGGPISWYSKKQAIVALSKSYTEYVALSAATQEAVWLRQLLTDFHVTIGESTVIVEGVIVIAGNPTGHVRTKHIDILYHFVRESMQKGTVGLLLSNNRNDR